MNALKLFHYVVFPHLWANHNIWPAVVGAVGAIGGALISSKASKDAAGNAIDASDAAAAQGVQYVDSATDSIGARLDPVAKWTNRGIQNIRSLRVPDAPKLKKFSFNADDLYDDPSYQFRLSQGQQGLDRIAGKNRQLTSGGRLVDAMNYNQGFASTEYQNAWQRALAENTTNNAVQQGKFANRMTRYGAKESKFRYLGDTGNAATQRLADYDYRTAVDKGNIAAGQAANSVSANMFQANATANAWSNAAQVGGYLGGQYIANRQPSAPTNTVQPYTGTGAGQWGDPNISPNKLSSWNDNWMTPGG